MLAALRRRLWQPTPLFALGQWRLLASMASTPEAMHAKKAQRCGLAQAGRAVENCGVLLRAGKAAKRAQREAAKLRDAMAHSVGFQSAEDPLTQVRGSAQRNALHKLFEAAIGLGHQRVSQPCRRRAW